jgi:hypothetical protein
VRFVLARTHVTVSSASSLVGTACTATDGRSTTRCMALVHAYTAKNVAISSRKSTMLVTLSFDTARGRLLLSAAASGGSM